MVRSSNVQVLVISDLHLDRQAVSLPKAEADIVLLAGDIGRKQDGIAWAKQQYPDSVVIHGLGNHEYYYQDYCLVYTQMREHAEGSNVHVLECETMELYGIAFLVCTLWTDFGLQGRTEEAKKKWRGSTDSALIWYGSEGVAFGPERAIEVYQRSIAWLRQSIAAASGPIVVMTHHAPSRRSLGSEDLKKVSSAAYASNCDELVENSGALLWVHGHVHHSLDYQIGRTRVLCNPRGYSKALNPNFNPELVVEL